MSRGNGLVQTFCKRTGRQADRFPGPRWATSVKPVYEAPRSTLASAAQMAISTGTTAHTSCCSARTMPMRCTTASRSGKMPTTSVCRRITRVGRSWGLFDQTWRRCSVWKAAKAVKSGAACPSISATRGKCARSSPTTRASWAGSAPQRNRLCLRAYPGRSVSTGASVRADQSG